VGGAVSKEDRIQKLVPIFEQRRFYLPKRLPFVDYMGTVKDFVQAFVTDEYLAFPVCVHDDMLDCVARILDPALSAEFPKLAPAKPKLASFGYTGGGAGWMG
jgi:phage terminase large subunit-like protein